MPRRLISAAILILVAIFVAIPTTTLTVFDGLPFDTVFKYVVCFVLLAAAVAPVRDRMLTRRLGAAIAVAAVLGIALKVILIEHRAYDGFLGCYRAGAQPNATCDRSFDNLFDRFGVSRVDKHIDFDGKTWRFGAANSLRFDDERRDHAQIPPVTFQATWTSAATASSATSVHVLYTGEGAIQIDDARTLLPATYGDGRGSADVPLAAGSHAVRLEYRFAPAPVEGRTDVAALSVSAPADVRWGTFAGGDPVIASTTDVLAVVIVLALAAGIIASDVRGAAGAGAAVGIALLWVMLPVGPRLHDKLLELIIIAGSLYWIWRERPSFPVALTALAILCVLRLGWSIGPPPGITHYRFWHDDPLIYESQVRDILQRHSWRGGEDVFFMQIFFRYVRFVERAIFGEGELAIVSTAMVAFNLTYGWLARRARTIAPLHVWLVLATSAVLLWTVNDLFGAVEAPLSEYPTWILAPLCVGLLFLSDEPRSWYMGGALAAIGTLDRFNQAPGYIALILVFLAGRITTTRRLEALGAAAIAALIVTGFPLAHNWWFGHELAILPTNRSGPNIDLPLRDVLSNAPGVWPALVWKIRQVLYIWVDYTPSFLALHALQAVLVIGAIAVWRRALVPGARYAWLLIAPVVTLGIHVFYIVHVYYPRHILFGYLLGGCIVLVLIAKDRRSYAD